MSAGLSYKSKDGEQLAENWIGPILPGPPRVLEFRIEGDDEEGGTIIAKADYIGGYEGYSEYWWLRISAAGQRTQISDPKPIPKGTPGGPNDPRYYTLTKGNWKHSPSRHRLPCCASLWIVLRRHFVPGEKPDPHCRCVCACVSVQRR